MIIQTLSLKPGCYATGPANDLVQLTLLRKRAARIITTQTTTRSLTKQIYSTLTLKTS